MYIHWVTFQISQRAKGRGHMPNFLADPWEFAITYVKS